MGGDDQLVANMMTSSKGSTAHLVVMGIFILVYKLSKNIGDDIEDGRLHQRGDNNGESK